MLKLDGLLVGYSRSAPILATPATEVHAGQLVCLLGRNGHGKSTLLRTLAGLQPPLRGTVELAGQAVDRLLPMERARRIGVVLTDRPHLPGMSAQELVELGRIPFTSTLGLLTQCDRDVALRSLDTIGGAHLAQRSLDTLSDGERQRVMIARALAQQPVLLLLDEVTAFLDLPSRVAICSTLRRIARDQRMAVVMSSHDLELAIQTADRLWVLPGDGTMVSGAPEDVALSGIIASAFDHKDIVFSLETGRFEPTAADGVPIAVGGRGLARAWARRAINRRGWRASDVTDGATGILVEATDTEAGFRWTVQWSDRRRSCGSIAELIDTLSELHDA